jgi:hypothetical protein
VTAKRKWATFYGTAAKHIPASANGYKDVALCVVSHGVNHGWGHRISTAKDVADRPLCGDCLRAAKRIASYIGAEK